MNADCPPLKVWIHNRHLTQNEDATGYEAGYVFAVQSYKGRALQFHVLLQSGAHFRHVPIHWLLWQPTASEMYDLDQLQLWDCYSYKPIVTVFDFLRDYSAGQSLKRKLKYQPPTFAPLIGSLIAISNLATSCSPTKTNAPTSSSLIVDSCVLCLRIESPSKTPFLSAMTVSPELKDTKPLIQSGPQKLANGGR
jgi:hypothetical protein